MRICLLRIRNLRILEEAELPLEPGLNWLVGANGAGKTSVLEACSLLAAGKSFRISAAGSLLRRGSEKVQVYAELESGLNAARHRVGLERSARSYRARIDGQDAGNLGELFAAVPMVFVEPESGSLISGPAELRRQFLDWGLFHVEPEFLSCWRRYQRALAQRNQALRQQLSRAALTPWTEAVIAHGEPLADLRARQCERLSAALQTRVDALLPGLGQCELVVRRGWPAASPDLVTSLAAVEGQDRRLGYTSVGPHRGSWTLRFGSGLERQQLSRGQAKLLALAAWLAQLEVFQALRGEAPMLGLDDVMAELDSNNQARVIAYLRESGVQALLTRAENFTSAPDLGPLDALFHVEQGRLARRV